MIHGSLHATYIYTGNISIGGVSNTAGGQHLKLKLWMIALSLDKIDALPNGQVEGSDTIRVASSGVDGRLNDEADIKQQHAWHEL